MRDVRLWLAHETYGEKIAAVKRRVADETRPRELAVLKSLSVAAARPFEAG